jgi:hypothetical protein
LRSSLFPAFSNPSNSVIVSNSIPRSPFPRMAPNHRPTLLRRTRVIVGDERVRILNSSFFRNFCWDDTLAASNPDICWTKSEVNVRRYRSCCSEGSAWSFVISSSARGPALSEDADVAAASEEDIGFQGSN